MRKGRKEGGREEDEKGKGRRKGRRKEGEEDEKGKEGRKGGREGRREMRREREGFALWVKAAKILVERNVTPRAPPKALNPGCAEIHGCTAHMASGNPPSPLTPYPANLSAKLLFFRPSAVLLCWEI
ncbi:Legumin A2, partial [Ophiophagus hannah]